MPAPSVTTTKTVIVADDTAFVRERFATALLSAGHSALTAKSAAELLARVDTIAQRRDAVRAALLAQGWGVPEAHGNFVWLPTGDATVKVAERLFDAGLVTRAFPPEGIRISIGEPESVETLLRILGELVPASQEGRTS